MKVPKIRQQPMRGLAKYDTSTLVNELINRAHKYGYDHDIMLGKNATFFYQYPNNPMVACFYLKISKGDSGYTVAELENESD